MLKSDPTRRSESLHPCTSCPQCPPFAAPKAPPLAWLKTVSFARCAAVHGQCVGSGSEPIHSAGPAPPQGLHMAAASLQQQVRARQPRTALVRLTAHARVQGTDSGRRQIRPVGAPAAGDRVDAVGQAQGRRWGAVRLGEERQLRDHCRRLQVTLVGPGETGRIPRAGEPAPGEARPCWLAVSSGGGRCLGLSRAPVGRPQRDAGAGGRDGRQLAGRGGRLTDCGHRR